MLSMLEKSVNALVMKLASPAMSQETAAYQMRTSDAANQADAYLARTAEG